MSKIHIVPPEIPKLSKEEIEHLKTHKLSKERISYIDEKYGKPMREREKKLKKKKRSEWWRNNWIALLSLIFAFIAALPYIIQGIETILKWLKLLN